jgi:alanine-glyoxylate transaminase/serine-glyoxylate transaminase/serine-pyruvate transaminase
MCQRHGLTVEVVETPWGEGIPAARFEEILRADKDGRIKAVLATHNETATGVLSDIAAVRGALNAAQHPALLFVDGVSSIASMPFEFDAWGVDVAVTGSQKGFMLPAGLAITGFSKRRSRRWKPAACRAASTTSATWPRATPPTAIPTRLRWAS